MEPGYIQIQILSKLMVSEYLSYSEARPDDIENDLYKYHLKFLIDKGYIQKTDQGYTLTELGKSFCHNITPSGIRQEKFHVCVMNIVQREIDGKTMFLLQKRTKHPFMGDVSFVTGKIIPGEKIIDAANRKLLEETGLSAKFKEIGLVREIDKSDTGIIDRDQWYVVCIANSVKGDLLEKTQWGENFWAEMDKIKSLRKVAKIVSGFLEKKTNFILELINGKLV